MADDALITYENIYEILRHEKYKKELHKLDKDFLEKVAKYINEKKVILQGYELKDSIFTSQNIPKLKRQIENIQLILKELYEKREGKIMQMALFNSRTNSALQDEDILLEDEKRLYNSIIETLNNSRNSILISLLEGKKSEVKNSKKPVKFIDNVQKFVDENMSVYGPYKPEDTAELPENIVKILVNGKKAVEI